MVKVHKVWMAIVELSMLSVDGYSRHSLKLKKPRCIMAINTAVSTDSLTRGIVYHIHVVCGQFSLLNWIKFHSNTFWYNHTCTVKFNFDI